MAIRMPHIAGSLADPSRSESLGSLLDWDYTEDDVGNVKQITGTAGGQPYSATFTYQDPQYFLTQGNGPWGTRTWTYDKIGNRLTETRGGTTDSYTYFSSPTGGHAPHLQQITLGLGGTAYYGYDPAGNVVQVSTPSSELSLAYDAGGQLFQLFEGVEDTGSRFSLDGRGFLAEAATETSVCAPLVAEASYSSEGLLYQRRQRSGLPGGALTSRISLFYFAGRPVAQLESLGTPAVRYLTTDHLGTPILAMTGTSASWVGGFEPFGADWSGAPAAGIFLRFPGQWSDPSWSVSGLYHNVRRWYQPSTGRYPQPDPIGLIGGIDLYSYVWVNPISWSDPLGLSPRPAPPSQRRTRLCNSDEYARCIEICGPKGVESCRVSQTFRLVRMRDGIQLWKWVDGPMSCSCNDVETPLQRCIRNVQDTINDILNWLADHPPHPPPLPLPPAPIPVPVPMPP